MKTLRIAVALIVLLCAWRRNSFTCSASMGVNYGQLGNNLLAPQQVVHLLQSMQTQMTKIKIYDSNPEILTAFANSGFEIVVGVGNEQLESIAADAKAAQIWVSQNVAAFLPATKISFITVGNEVLTLDDLQLISNLLPAMENIHAALVSLNLDGLVKVSTPHSYGVLSVSFPPSAGAFRPDLSQNMQPILNFLSKTNSVFMANVYPFFSYSNNPQEISLAYALFQSDQKVSDPNTGLSYTNLFSAQLDAVYSALDKLGFHEMAVTVSETGWPSEGDGSEAGAGIQNAKSYNKNLVSYVVAVSGTPLRPQQAVDAYIFALFNENEKPGPTSERNFGLFNPDGSAVYDCGLMNNRIDPSLPPPVSSQAPSPTTAPSIPTTSLNLTIQNTSTHYNPGNVSGNGAIKQWCVAKQGIEDNVLAAAIKYACTDGGVDCAAVQTGGACYDPNTLYSHASYAFNSYYQKNGRNSWNCDFRSSATTSASDPSYGGCIYLSS